MAYIKYGGMEVSWILGELQDQVYKDFISKGHTEVTNPYGIKGIKVKKEGNMLYTHSIYSASITYPWVQYNILKRIKKKGIKNELEQKIMKQSKEDGETNLLELKWLAKLGMIKLKLFGHYGNECGGVSVGGKIPKINHHSQL